MLAPPSSALSLHLALRTARSDGSDLTVTVNRGTDPASYTQNVVSSETVNVGTWQAVVTCFADSNGTGTVVGTGQATVTIAPDGTGIGNIAINGVVESVTVTADQSVPIATHADLGFTCRNAEGALLTVSPGSAFFTVTAGSDRLRIVNGRAEGLLPGTATVQASVDGIVSAPATVQVTSSATVSIAPPDTTVLVEGIQNFSAQVANAPDQNVIWSVQEGAAGGTITANGLYHAPASPGTYHVVATSVYDPSKQAVATVTVQAVSTRIVYQNDFNGTVGQEWSKTNTEITPVGARHFLGQFGKDTVTLSLTDLPPHTTITVSFKLFVIRSWDGNNTFGGNGPDIFQVNVDGGLPLLDTTFSNIYYFSGFNQSYPNATGQGDFPPFTGATENRTLGYIEPGGSPSDSVYDLVVTCPHSARTLQVNFRSHQTEGSTNESWGIDSVQVTVSGR